MHNAGRGPSNSEFLVNMLLTAGPNVEAGSLWEELADSLVEDYVRTKPLVAAKDLALQDIQKVMETRGKKKLRLCRLAQPGQLRP